MTNIQEYQIKNKENEILNSILLRGNEVTAHEVIAKLNNFFSKNTPGLPYYKNLNIKSHSKSDKKIYNDSFETLEGDLNTAYTVYNNQEKSILEAKNTFDSEILDLYREFDELNSEIQLANDFSNQGIIYHPYIINFNNLLHVNTKNLYRHNIPNTTCEIDFDKSVLRNELYSTPSDKLDLSKSTISISSNTKSISSTSEIKDIIKENSTDVISMYTSSKVNASGHELYIDISLDNYYDISKIAFSCFNISNSYVSLLLSDDGSNYVEREIKEGARYVEWIFNKRKVKSFRIVIKKTDYDIKQNNSTMCIYSILNISAYNDKYSLNGVFTSNEIKFSEPITEIMVQPTHSIPPNTDIGYFVGYEDKDDDVKWYPIKPNELIDLNLLYKEEDILNYIAGSNSGSNIVFGRWDYTRGENSKKLFYISELPKYTNLNSIEVRAGHSQWLIERLDMTEKYGQSYPKDKKVNINDYSRQYVKAIAPLDMNMTDIRCEKEWNYFVMSSYIVCSKETVVENRFFTYNFALDESGNKIECLDVALIINGRRVYPKDGRFSFRFKEGENTIKIMVLFGNQDITNLNREDGIKYLSHNFNLLNVSDFVFAGPRMKRMNYNYLGEYIHEFDLKNYAIKTVDDTDYIVTKFDPNFIIAPFDPYDAETLDLDDDCKVGKTQYFNPVNIYMNNSEYMRMFVKYRHMLESTRENITNSKSDSDIRIRLMARLTSNDVSVSPSIKKIKVVGV